MEHSKHQRGGTVFVWRSEQERGCFDSGIRERLHSRHPSCPGLRPDAPRELLSPAISSATV
jgi:hypothetical protein